MKATVEHYVIARGRMVAVGLCPEQPATVTVESMEELATAMERWNAAYFLEDCIAEGAD